MKILSFVIPAYNSAAFLDKCANSLLREDLLDKIEIIIVNDGSTDRTEEIALKYCKSFPDTVRLISQENRGHGGALNAGCFAATGKYLKVLDADDWIETDNLPEFIAELEKLNSDVVLTHYYTVNIGNSEIKSWKSYPENFGRDYSFEEITADWRSFERVFTLHGITYNTRFYQKYGIKLSEKVFYEDQEFSTFPACYAEAVTPLDIFIYDYRIGDVTQSVSDENQLKRITHIETVLSRMLKEYKSLAHDTSSAVREFICVKTKILLLSYLTTVLLVKRDKKKGRKQAEQTASLFREHMPRAWELSERQYKQLVLMNRMHINKKTFDKLISSRLYMKLKGNYDFG